MRAIILNDDVPVPQLEEREIERPAAGPGCLVVRVAAAGLNRAQLASPQRTGHAVHPLGIPGGELSGVVAEVGPGVSGFTVGDRVMALASGSYAQYAAFDHRLAIHVPEALDLLTAAALPSWYMTAHNAVVTEGRLQAGEIMLVQGATSGVGNAAAQIARYLNAGRIIGVARSPEKLAQLDVYDDKLVANADWPEHLLELTGGAGADLIIDMVGRGALSSNLQAASLGGRIVAVGRLGGPSDELDLNSLARKRLRMTGVSFRTRTIEQNVAIAHAFERDILPAIVDGHIAPRIDRSFPLHEVREAQDYLRTQTTLGKVLLKIEH